MQMKKMVLALALVGMLAGSAMSAQLLTGGNIPLINNIVGVGVMTLDFSSAATVPVEIGNFIINCNGNSFDVSWTFANSAEFTKNVAEAILMTALTIEPNANQPAGSHKGVGVEILDPAVGSGLGDPIVATGGNILALAKTGAAVNWSPTDQTDATTNYAISMKARWGDASSMLAGLYTESIVFSIVATIN